MTRTERQELGILKLSQNNYIGIWLWFTGFGKSRAAIKAILDSKAKDVVIIVPTKYLKKQWESLLVDLNIKSRVYVINTASKLDIKTDFLVIDEIHTACSDMFSNIFNTNFKYFLGLTATAREDEKWLRALKIAPVVDIISIEEGIENDWIAKHNVFTIPVKLKKAENLKLQKINKSYNEVRKELTSLSGYNALKAANEFIMWINIKKNKDNYKVSKKSNIIYSTKTIITKFNKANVPINWDLFRNLTSDEIKSKFELALLAKEFYSLVRRRKDLLQTCKNKKVIINKLLEKHYNNKIIVFSESIAFLYTLNHNDCFYHSKQSKKINDESLSNFINNKTNLIFSAKALNTGVDIKGVDVGIVSSFNSSKLLGTQTIGRATRKEEETKVSYIYYPYVKDTQEEIWLKKALKNIKTKELIIKH